MTRSASPPRPAPEAAAVPGASLEGELARFFAYSHDILMIMDGVGRVVLVSPSVERTLGYPPGDLVGQRVLHWVHTEDQAAVKKQVRALLDGHAIADLDARVVHSDGTWVPMRWSLSLGRRRRIYAVGRDRTDEAARQEALLRKEMAELRLRTTMELHDGILQTLTGAGLQIAVARRLVGSDPDAAEAVLRTLGDSVAAEQREIRLYVDELKGKAPAWTTGAPNLAGRIETMIKRVGMIWGVATSVEARLPDDVPAELGRQVLRIVQEATVNAARHGAAQAVEVTVGVAPEGPEVTIAVSDDGTGFSFLGDYDDDALKAQRLGPLSLKHRVATAGGRMHIHSSPGGSTLTVRLPLVGEDAL